jgi:hypothetical protein
MTDEASAVLPASSRDPVDRITDDMLLRPLRTLTPPERAMIRRAINRERAEEFMNRIEALRRQRQSGSKTDE